MKGLGVRRKNQFPEKPSIEAGLEEEISHTQELLPVLEEGAAASGEK